MFGFPSKLEESFYEAWQEPFTGFELKWIEVEICRQAMVPTNVTDLFETMKERYPDIQSMHHSKFYRTVSSLEESGYISSDTEGRSKIIKTTDSGAKELGRITRYFFEIQMERMKSAIWQDMIAKITVPLGCLLDQEVIVLGPEYITINLLIKLCASCPPRTEKIENIDIEDTQKQFHFLNHQAVLQGRTESSNIFDIEAIDLWPYRENFKPLIIMFNALSNFKDDAVSILKEAKRVMADDGHIIVFELLQRDSKLVSTLMRESSMLINFSNPSPSWKIPETLPDLQDIHEWIEEAGLSVEKEFDDVISSIFILN